MVQSMVQPSTPPLYGELNYRAENKTYNSITQAGGTIMVTTAYSLLPTTPEKLVENGQRQL